MAGHQVHKGATVYGTGDTKVGTIRACDVRGGYLVVQTGWLFGPDIHIALNAVREIDAVGNVHLGLYTDMMTEAERAAATVQMNGVAAAGVDAPHRWTRQGVDGRGDSEGEQAGLGADATRPYRALAYGERAVRRTCAACGDRHAALIDWRTWTLQCRRCARVFVRPFLFGTRERRVRGGVVAPAPRRMADDGDAGGVIGPSRTS